MFKVLDCTLRDGGYYTNWDFSRDLVLEYLETMRSLSIDIVEVGYRSPPKSGYYGKYFYLSRQEIEFLRKRLGSEAKLAIMLNKKDVRIADIASLMGDCNDLVDIVRFACPPNEIPECIELAQELSRMNIQVAINVMYLHTYIDDITPLLPLAAAKDCVQFVSLVDSYGGCLPQDVERATRSVVDSLPQEIGFHGHDNIGMAFANALAAIQGGAKIIDCTVTGMGRGAGNLSTELFTAYREKATGVPVAYKKLAHLLERFELMKKEYGWGTSLPYMISGLNGLPQAEVMSWLSRRRYTPSSIVSSLRRHNSATIDTTTFPPISQAAKDLDLTSSTVVVIGGGASAAEHIDGLRMFLEQSDVIVLHSSLKNARLLNGHGKQLYCLAGEEAASVSSDELEEIGRHATCWIVQSPPRFADSVPLSGKVFQVDSRGEDFLGPVSDASPMRLALATAIELSADTVLLYGFDGYDNATPNEIELMEEVQSVIDSFRAEHDQLQIKSLLPSQYRVEHVSVYAPLTTTE